MEYFLIGYFIFICFIYLLLCLKSIVSMFSYKRNKDFFDYEELLGSDLIPRVSLVVPAYNEAATILNSVKSHISMDYHDYEVIVVNDGSKDDTMQILKDNFDLEPYQDIHSEFIATKPIRQVYVSTLPLYKDLLKVIDKDNGGKGDAINAAINLCSGDYLLCVDSDSIMKENTITRLISVVLQSRLRVVAVGSFIGIVNNCIVKNGKIQEVSLPKKWIERFQVLEYNRAFVFGRVPFSKVNSLLIISGAVGLFETAIVKEIGGYDTSMIGEDMDLVIRMHEHMIKKGKKYSIRYVHEPLCWTQVPYNFKIFYFQRLRWTRGLIQCLNRYKFMLFNLKYKNVGLLAFPYYFFLEWLFPFIEAIGIFIMIYLFFQGHLTYMFILTVLSFFYSISLVALDIEQMLHNTYKSTRSLFILFLVILFEPFTFFPIKLFIFINGNIIHLFDRKKKVFWKDMDRKAL